MNLFNNYQPTMQFNRPQIDENKFNQEVTKLDKEKLVQLVKQARAQGIPDSQIEAGLNYILGLK